MNFIDRISSYSDTYFIVAFALYCLSFILFVIAVTGKRWGGGNNPEHHGRVWGKRAFAVTAAGFVFQLLFFFTRWYNAGHIPTSNMYEFMTFLGMMIVLAVIVIYLIYKNNIVGMFAMPVGILILAYAAVFPNEIQPLIPALQSIWLSIHVTLAALGEAFFAIGFAGGLMYLLRTVNYASKAKKDVREQRWVEFTLFCILMVIGFVGSIFAFNAAGYHAQFDTVQTVKTPDGDFEHTIVVDYVLPPIFAPHDAELIKMTPFLGMKKPLLEAPSWMEGVNAGRKLNTITWSVVTGLLLYGLLRLALRKPIGAAISPAVQGIDPEDLDEVSYRTIAIGYPIFTLGALIFAMIWAAEAWGRFWGWDPKKCGR